MKARQAQLRIGGGKSHVAQSDLRVTDGNAAPCLGDRDSCRADLGGCQGATGLDLLERGVARRIQNDVVEVHIQIDDLHRGLLGPFCSHRQPAIHDAKRLDIHDEAATVRPFDRT